MKNERKSSGERWRSYIHRDVEVKKIEAYLENPLSAPNYLELIDLQIPLKTLIEDTDYSKAPTTEWYTIHTCVQGGRKWDQELIAWGLNRMRVDMYELQYNVVSYIMEERSRAIEKDKSTDMAVLPLNLIDDRFRRAYQSMAPRFVDAIVPASWYLNAQHQFLAKCKRSAIGMLGRGFYDQKSNQWTRAGIDNWNDLYHSSDSPEELVRPSFALVKDSEDMPPQEAISPYIQCMPTELLTRVLNYVLDPPTLGQESDLAKTSRWLRENAREWSRRQTVTIRASHWPQNPPRRFPTDKLPIEWLQSLEKVQFDFDGVDYSNRQTVHPVMEQLAEIWKKRNELESLVLPVAPNMKYLLQQEPRVKLDPVQKSTFAPLLKIPDIEPEYTADFRAPVDVSGYNALCELVRPGNEAFERSLRLVLGRAQVSINTKCGKHDLTPLHISVCCSGTKSTELLLDTPGIDVNAQDKYGDTAFDHVTSSGGPAVAILLTRHKGFKATETNFVNMVNRMRNSRVIFALCDAYGGVPPCVANDLAIRRDLQDAGRLI